MVMHLWEENAASPMHCVHFGFALGAIIVPQIARPFLVEDLHPEMHFPNLTSNLDLVQREERDVHDRDVRAADSMETGSAVEMTSAQDTGTVVILEANLASGLFNITSERRKSHYERAYYIVAIVDVLIAFIAMPILAYASSGFRPRGERNLRRMCSVRACSPTSPRCGYYTLICLFIYVANIVGVERCLGKYMYAYLVSPLVRMNSRTASHVVTTFWAAFAAGRLLGIFSAKLQQLNTQICVNNLLYFGFAMAFYLVKNAHDGLWTYFVFMGFFVSSMFPNAMSWANLNLKLNCIAVMWLMMGSATGGLLYQYFTGFFFEKNGPVALPQMCVFGAVSIAVTFFMLTVMSLVTCRAAANDNNEEFEMQLEVAAERLRRRQLFSWNS